MTRDFAVRFEQVTAEPQRREALAALGRFHDGRWSGREASTAFLTTELRAFHADATTRTLESGSLRLYALYLDDQIAGVMYAFAYDGRFYFYQHGFDARYLSHSPGLLLMALTIRAALDEGAVEFDLLYGVESYKRLWADDAKHLGRLDLFPPRLSGLLHRHRVDAESTLRALARRMHPRDGHVA